MKKIIKTQFKGNNKQGANQYKVRFIYTHSTKQRIYEQINDVLTINAVINKYYKSTKSTYQGMERTNVQMYQIFKSTYIRNP